MQKSCVTLFQNEYFKSFSHRLLFGRRHLSDGVFYRGDRRSSLPASEQFPGRPGLHLLRHVALDHSHLRTFRFQDLSTSFLNFSVETFNSIWT